MDPNNNPNGGVDSSNSPQPGSQPGNGTSERDERLSRDEVNRILRGQGKELEKLKAENAALMAADEKRKLAEEEAQNQQLSEQGKFKELLEKEKAEKGTLATKYQELKIAMEERLEKVKADNEKRIKALPKNHQALIPPLLGPDETAEQISKIESLLKTETVRVHGGAGRSEEPKTPEDKKEALFAAGRKYLE